MHDNQEFTFKNKAAIKNASDTLGSILQEYDNLQSNLLSGAHDQLRKKLENIDRPLVDRTKILLDTVYRADEQISEYLDKKCFYTCSKHKNRITTFNHFNDSTLHNLIPFSLDNLIIFLALLSAEITYRHYSQISISTDYAPFLKEILQEMEAFHNNYTSDKPPLVPQENKNHVRYYPTALQALDIETEKKNISLSIAGIKKLHDDASAALKDAKKIIPKEIQAALVQNASKLSTDFGNLLSKKQNNKKWQIGGLIVMSLLLIIMPILTYFHGWNPESSDWENGYKFTSFFALEGLLIYFFRIILLNYYKLKTEIIQLEIREALAKFLPSYVAFSRDKEHNPVIEHFSNFIFKPLVSNAEDIPKITDGLEPLIEIVSRKNR